MRAPSLSNPGLPAGKGKGANTSSSGADASEREDLNGEKKPVYRGRVDLNKKSVQRMRRQSDLTPGMLAKADFKVGERRLITYFTNPIVRGLDSAFKEPN